MNYLTLYDSVQYQLLKSAAHLTLGLGIPIGRHGIR